MLVEGIRFALGASLGVTRQALQEIGGLAVLADYLADDYQLGRRVAEAGYRVRLLPYAVETGDPGLSFRYISCTNCAGPGRSGCAAPPATWPTGITQALIFSLAAWAASGGPGYALGLLAATLVVRGALARFSQNLCLKGVLPWAALWAGAR